MSLTGTEVTVLHSDNTTSRIVTAVPPGLERARLNTALTSGSYTERPAFMAFRAVDGETVHYVNLDLVYMIDLDPITLASVEETHA